MAVDVDGLVDDLADGAEVEIEAEAEARAVALDGASGVLQPMHSCVFFANFMSPPIVGAATAIERVCAPVNSCDAFFSPRMGVKMRSSGFVSWLSR